jgi:hypothetical protein
MAKVKVKAYLVISPQGSRRHSRENIFVGGVASSCASEMAGEEGGFVVTLEGEYDQEQLVEMYQDQVARCKERIEQETAWEPRFRTYPKNAERQTKHVAELMQSYLAAEKELEDMKKELQT